jgi:hypothetical protein
MLTTSFLLSIAIGAAALALTYSVCYRWLNLPKNAAAVIGFAFGLITYLFLKDNPAILLKASSEIALAMIAALIGLAWLVKRSTQR